MRTQTQCHEQTSKQRGLHVDHDEKTAATRVLASFTVQVMTTWTWIDFNNWSCDAHDEYERGLSEEAKRELSLAQHKSRFQERVTEMLRALQRE